MTVAEDLLPFPVLFCFHIARSWLWASKCYNKKITCIENYPQLALYDSKEIVSF